MQNMNEHIKIIFKFKDRRFDISIKPTESLQVLKSYIINTLNSKIKFENYRDTCHIKQVSGDDIILNKQQTPLILYGDEYDNISLIGLNFKNDEEIQILIKCAKDYIEFNEKAIKEKEITPNISSNQSKPSIILKKIPGDNSCLFNSVNFAINQCLSEPQILRELIAVEIKSNPELYNEAILETDPQDYCNWIMKSESWGWGIELSILAKCFGVRIDVVDILNDTVENIGDMYTKVIYLLYNGLHYDVFVEVQNDGSTKGVFDANDKQIQTNVMSIANEIRIKLKNEKNLFVYKCEDCDLILKNKKEVKEHSKFTKHKNYEEIKNDMIEVHKT